MKIEAIWSEYQTTLKAFLLKHVSNADDVDDLLQEIMLKTHQNLHRIEDVNKLKPWLFQVANRAVIDFYRSRSKKDNFDPDDLWYEHIEKSLYQQMTHCVIPFIQALPEEEAKLLTAIEIEGISQKEYAQQIGVAYSTLKSRVQKGRRLLFEVFNQCCNFSVNEQGELVDYHTKNRSCSKC
ncbi:RNA polymerase sigma factor SigZ [Vibrio superstes]|uniref:RNA polymerase sigma factor SigZ n=1 Tax=Vibrio superstes NBRC 103154 TaxID=1219062 RepID=A0A511QSX8_9VIBR|nr:RNA polymerase sigma factor SigZ [Vibrio superstes]GEM79956.1 RNA polymerase sigma factor SigZ [Vibrio superstes NBRC 103154]